MVRATNGRGWLLLRIVSARENRAGIQMIHVRYLATVVLRKGGRINGVTNEKGTKGGKLLFWDSLVTDLVFFRNEPVKLTPSSLCYKEKINCTENCNMMWSNVMARDRRFWGRFERCISA